MFLFKLAIINYIFIIQLNPYLKQLCTYYEYKLLIDINELTVEGENHQHSLPFIKSQDLFTI